MTDKRCEELLEQEKYEDLAAYCKERLMTNPESEDHLFYGAMAFVALHNLAHAEGNFTKLFTKYKKYIYLICRGIVRFISGNAEQGRNDLMEAIRNDKSSVDVLFAFRAAMRFHDLDSARMAISKAVSMDKKAALAEFEDLFEELSKNSNQDERIVFARVMGLLKSAFD